MYKGTILSIYSTFFIYAYSIEYGNIYNMIINLYGWIKDELCKGIYKDIQR
jgi:hypothetical protein